MPWPSPPGSPLQLTDIGQVLQYGASQPVLDLHANLHGLVTKATPFGGSVLLNLFDGLHSIPLLAEKKDFRETEWKVIRSIKSSQRLTAEGPVARIGRDGRITVLLKSVPVIEPPLTRLESTAPPFSSGRVGLQMLLAEFRKRGARFLTDRGFLEIEPRLISTSWSETLMQPLRAVYPGFGLPTTFLIPSPAPQLVKALVVTGSDRVFCASHSFTTTHRGDTIGTESLIMMAQLLNVDLDAVVALARQTLTEVLGAITDKVVQGFVGTDWSRRVLEWPPLPAETDVAAPEVHEFRRVDAEDPSLSGTELSLFRICWPRNSTLVEGGLEQLDEPVTLGFFSIYLERVALLSHSEDIRRIANLSHSAQVMASKGG